MVPPHAALATSPPTAGSPTTGSPTSHRPARRLGALAGLVGLAAGGLLAVSLVAPAAASADNVMPHDPIGNLGQVTKTKVRNSAGGVTMTGWAADPDDRTANVTVSALVDGRPVGATTPTSIAKPKLSRTKNLGPTPGFSLTVPLTKGGHTVCLAVRNLGKGMTGILGCVATPLNRTLSSTQLAEHSPQGRITVARASRSSLTVGGWSTDPDAIGRRDVVVLYVDGSPAETLATTRYKTTHGGSLPTGAGRRSAFTATVPVSSGSHVACIWAVNVGFGSNSLYGCRALDTRGKHGTGPVTQPKLNKQVLRQAKTHIGQSYVWGAEGPKTFDCSGLVMYSYGKFGYTTPRVAADQFAAARVIPKARAVPGDLVFYHDSEGSVYHVGIFDGPGNSVAAIDTAEGVNYQSIYPGEFGVSYGSFTHT